MVHSFHAHRLLGRLALAFAVALAFPTCALAEPVQDSTPQPETDTSATETDSARVPEATPEPTGDSYKWKTSKGRVRLYKNNKKVKGLHAYDGKWYFFDKKGIQRTGWQRIKGQYRFFKIASGKKAYMLTSTVVNGVKLTSSGEARLNTTSLAELELMTRANHLMQKWTKPGDTKEQKLRKVWTAFTGKKLNHGHYKRALKSHFRMRRTFYSWKTQHRTFARDLLFDKYGDCNSFAAAFAYVANAIGFEHISLQSNGSHGWVMIGERMFDPEYARYHPGINGFVTFQQARRRGAYDRYNLYSPRWNYSLAPNATPWKGAVVKAKKASTGKTGWSMDGTTYRAKDGKRMKGPVFIDGKAYLFDKRGKLQLKKSEKLRALVKKGTELDDLTALIGKPGSSVYVASCITYKGSEGDDGILTYKHFKVFTFRTAGGTEYVMGAE